MGEIFARNRMSGLLASTFLKLFYPKGLEWIVIVVQCGSNTKINQRKDCHYEIYAVKQDAPVLEEHVTMDSHDWLQKLV